MNKPEFVVLSRDEQEDGVVDELRARFDDQGNLHLESWYRLSSNQEMKCWNDEGSFIPAESLSKLQEMLENHIDRPVRR